MDGKLIQNAGGYELRFARTYHHPVERVWSALVDPTERAEWFFPGTLELGVGGAVLLQDPARGVTGTVTAIDPPRLLEFSWSSHDAPTGTVRFDLSDASGGRCVLRLTQTTDHTAKPENLLAAWHCVVDDLVRHLDGEPVSDAPGRWATLRQRYLEAVHS